MKICRNDISNGNLKSSQWIIMLPLILAGINFMNYFYYFVIISFAVLILYKKKLILNNTIPYFVFAVSVFISIMVWSGSIPTAVKESVYSLICFLVGILILRDCYDSTKEKESQIEKLILIVPFSLFIHFCLNAVINFNSAVFRNTIDIWTGTSMSATGQAALGSLFLAVMISWIVTTNGLKKKIVPIACVLLIIIYSLKLASRTNFVLCLILIISSIVIELIVGNKKKVFAVVAILSLIILITIWVFQSNLFGVQDLLSNTNFYIRFFSMNSVEDIFENARSRYVMYFLDNLDLSVFGGGNIRNLVGGYAHNIILDCYDSYGLFGACSLIAIIISSVINLVNLIRKTGLSNRIKNMFFCIYITFYIEMLSEPILQGLPVIFACFCFFNGLVVYINLTDNRGKHK